MRGFCIDPCLGWEAAVSFEMIQGLSRHGVTGLQGLVFFAFEGGQGRVLTAPLLFFPVFAKVHVHACFEQSVEDVVDGGLAGSALCLGAG